MKAPTTLLLSAGIILLSIIFNHWGPLGSLLLTPIIFIIIALLICMVDKELKIVEKSVALGTAFIVHDLANMIYSDVSYRHQGGALALSDRYDSSLCHPVSKNA